MGPSDGPLRFLITDSKSENAVMSGKLSVSQVNELNVIDSITITLKAKHATVKVGKTAVFTGVVTNAVTKDTSVKLRVMKGKKFILAKAGHITSKGAFRLTYKVKKAGKRTFMVTYRIGKTLFTSPKVTITVKK